MEKFPIILSYHRIHPDQGEDSVVNTPSQLSSHIKLLKLLGFNIIDLQGWLNRVELDKKRYVILTFDDGWEDNYKYAFHILLKHKVTATIFLISNYVGSNKMPSGMITAHGRSFLTLEQILIMQEKGVDFQSHTANHRILTESTDDQISSEISTSKKKLQSLLNKDVNIICYPKSKTSPKVMQIAKNAGYKAGVLTIPFGEQIPGFANEFSLIRMGVYSKDSLLRFTLKLVVYKIKITLFNIKRQWRYSD